jgi:hypothetical protein
MYKFCKIFINLVCSKNSLSGLNNLISAVYILLAPYLYWYILHILYLYWYILQVLYLYWYILQVLCTGIKSPASLPYIHTGKSHLSSCFLLNFHHFHMLKYTMYFVPSKGSI